MFREKKNHIFLLLNLNVTYLITFQDTVHIRFSMPTLILVTNRSRYPDFYVINEGHNIRVPEIRGTFLSKVRF